MRIARFSFNNVPRYAFVQNDKNDGNDYLVELDGHPLSGQQVQPTGQRYRLDAEGVRLLSPVIPSKIYGLAKNYRDSSADAGQPSGVRSREPLDDMTIFMKSSTSVVGPDDPIVCPSFSKDMGYEPELVVIMGKMAKNVSEVDAMDYVFGFTCGNDLTLRDVQQDDPMWTRAKGFDTSCPLGPWIETDLRYENTSISLKLNGKEITEAAGVTTDMIYSIPQQIAYISSFATLLPGDAIMTGTPHKSGRISERDEVIVGIKGIGELRNVAI